MGLPYAVAKAERRLTEAAGGAAARLGLTATDEDEQEEEPQQGAARERSFDAARGNASMREALRPLALALYPYVRGGSEAVLLAHGYESQRAQYLASSRCR